ncbi:MAG: hypothetical protein ACXADB_09710, partial [Candidatus Hermodarchaeia archaeon]
CSNFSFVVAILRPLLQQVLYRSSFSVPHMYIKSDFQKVNVTRESTKAGKNSPNTIRSSALMHLQNSYHYKKAWFSRFQT